MCIIEELDLFEKGGKSMEEKNKDINGKIDELIEEFKNVENWNQYIPEFDDEALMVHWTNCSGPVTSVLS